MLVKPDLHEIIMYVWYYMYLYKKLDQYWHWGTFAKKIYFAPQKSKNTMCTLLLKISDDR